MSPRKVNEKQGQGNTFFGGVAVLAVGIMVVKLIGMFYKIPLGNIIGEQGYADFTNAYNIYAVLLTVSTTGLPVALSKMISEANTQGNHQQVEKIFQVALKFFFCLGVISFVLMFFFADFLAELMGDSYAAPGIRALSPAVIFVSCVAAFRGYFQGHTNMTPTAVSQIIEAMSKLVLGLTLAYFVMKMDFTQEMLQRFQSEIDLADMTAKEIQASMASTQASLGAAGAIVGVTVGTALALGFLVVTYLVQGRKRTRKGELQVQSQQDIIRSLLAIAIPITLTSSMASIVNLLDAGLVQQQLQSALGMTENESRSLYGNYSWAVNIYNLPLSMITAITVSVIPTVSGALAKRERKRGATIAISALRMTALLSMPMGMGLFVLGKPIIALLYPTANIQLAGSLLSYLGIVSCFVCLSLVCTSILQVYGFFHLPIIITLMGGTVKVVTNYILVGTPTIGIYGAPIGNFFCFFLCFALSLSILNRSVPGLKRSYDLFYKPLFASVVMGGCAWAVYGMLSRMFLSIQSFQGEIEGQLSRTGEGIATLATIGVAGVVYLLVILNIGGVSKEDILMMPKGEKLAKLLKLRG